MMSEDASEQLIQSQEDAAFFFIALDESTDATYQGCRIPGGMWDISPQ